jgi:hypothetical protein
MKLIRLYASAAVIALSAAGLPVHAQDTQAPAEEAAPAQEASPTGETPAPVVAAIDLTCGDIASLEAAHAAALVYYVAGYADAQRDAGTPAPAGANTMVGGLTLSAAAILEACASQPTAFVRDVVAAQGGSGGTAAPATAPAEETAPAEGATEPVPAGDTAPAGETTAPADGTTAPTGTTTETPAQ